MAKAIGNQSEDRPDRDSDGGPAEVAPSVSRSSGSSPQVMPYRQPGGKDRAPSAGFFSIYKKGQGYWTRMVTAGGAVLLIALTAQFLYSQLPTAWNVPKNITIGVVVAFVVASVVWGYRLMNRPGNADFLIATDSEMKKVNWASRSELIGSTKVVIGFMFLTAIVLFLIDWLFGVLFYLIKVLVNPPPFFPKIYG